MGGNALLGAESVCVFALGPDLSAETQSHTVIYEYLK